MNDRIPLISLCGALAARYARPGELPAFPLQWTRNTIQYGAADALGLLLSGSLTGKPLGMYIQYCNVIGSWTNPTDFGRDGRTYFHTIGDGISDILRVPLTVNPSVDSSDTGVYESNRVRFVAMTAGADGEAGLIQPAVTFQRGVSVVVGGGLIAMPVTDDYTQDIVLTRGYLSDTLTRPASPHEVMMMWKLEVG